MTGRILRGVGGQYWIEADSGDVGIASARGILRMDSQVPAVGDFVQCSPSGDPDVPWRVDCLLPRRNFLIRPAIANLDGLVITLSATNPPPDYYLVDKLLAVCLINKIEPLLCLTKTDLSDDWQNITRCYRSVGCKIIETAPEDQDSLNLLRQWIVKRVVSFAGQSGVGKSTLLNRLFGTEMMPAGNISTRAGRGRHTTRRVELFPIAGGYLADTPGFSSLELYDLGINGEQLVQGYPEIAGVAGQCRFAGCRHLGDLGCAVPESGIDPDRLQRYRFFRVQLDSIDPYSGNRPRPKH